jgi:hypothetical protein
MKETVETQMNKLKLSEKLIQDAVNILPFKPLENDLTFITPTNILKMENAATKIKLPIAKRSNKGCEALQNDERVFLMGKT